MTSTNTAHAAVTQEDVTSGLRLCVDERFIDERSRWRRNLDRAKIGAVLIGSNVAVAAVLVLIAR
jgi:hypothetical protein